MASKKDLVEAHSFNRRRLVTAFVSGAPGGREVEPVRYGRTLVGGLVLAALVVVGAAVTPLVRTSTLPKDWAQNGMVIGKESGSRFVAFKGTLFPVINTTSARLALGTQGDLKVTFVPDAKIAARKPGPTIGIPGAPDLLPAPGHLLDSGWTACTNGVGGIRVDVESTPPVTPSAHGALVVAEGGTTYVVAGSHRYPVPPGTLGVSVLRALGLDAEEVKAVPGQWLDLVPPGPGLAPFRVPGEGGRLATGVDGLTVVGTPVRVDDRPYVLTRKGLLPVTDFAYTLYRSAGAGAELPEKRLPSSGLGGIDTVNDPGTSAYPADWPEGDVTAFAQGDTPCLLLTTHQDSAAGVQLAAPRTSTATAPDGTVSRTVEAGHGALVQASSAGVIGAGTTFLVDATGTRYAVGEKGTVGDAMSALGYAGSRPVPVPAGWLDLFADGPALTRQAATQTAGSQS